MADKILQLPDMITVGELADKLDLPVTTLVGELFKNGIVATINQRIDFETAQIIIEELGLEVSVELKNSANESHPEKTERVLSAKAAARPPIVAVMGHVDHGKTSLLDAILDTKVAAGEAGGITQHISAYQTEKNGRKITLLDTPGHEAFSALRQHGAALTDVVIIVVAGDDGVKPQTVEAIKFAQTAHAKIVVAITKMDKPEADVNRVKAQLAEHGLQTEEWGGDVVMVPVSSKTGEGLDKLLDMVLLVADIEDLKAETDIPAEGLVIEARMDKGRGATARLLVEHGVLKPSQLIVAGSTYAKIRTMQDYAHRNISEAGPSTPAIVTGFKETPQFGDRFEVVNSEKAARAKAESNRASAAQNTASTNVTSSDLLKMISKKHEVKELNVIIKADVQGSLTSVIDSLRLLETNEVNVRIVSSGVGNITENDVQTAAAAGAIIYGFNVILPPAQKRLSAREKVEVRLYSVIYELLDDIKIGLEDLLAPEVVETAVGELEVKGVFKITKTEIIAGGEVKSGKIEPGVLARLIRRLADGQEDLGEAEVTGLQREKQDVKEVREGDICGLSLKTNAKILLQIGDKIEFFKRELKKRKL